MALSFQNLFDPAVWSGAGGAALGLVGGHVKLRWGRLARLEAEVAECRKRDGDFQIMAAGVRMMVGEMKRSAPDSPALQMFGDLLDRRLGPPPKIDDLADLLRRIDEAAARSSAAHQPSHSALENEDPR